MSSFNLEAQLHEKGENVPAMFKEQVRRQLDDFNMGVSMGFPPDPNMNWAPWLACRQEGCTLLEAGAGLPGQVAIIDDEEDEINKGDEEDKKKKKKRKPRKKKKKTTTDDDLKNNEQARDSLASIDDEEDETNKGGEEDEEKKKETLRKKNKKPSADDNLDNNKQAPGAAKDSKVDTATDDEPKPPRYHGVQPSHKIIRRGLRRSGYCTIWPQLPDVTCIKPPIDVLTRFKSLSAGIVQPSGYKKVIFLMGHMLEGAHKSLQGNVIKHEAEILAAVNTLAENDSRGRDSEGVDPTGLQDLLCKTWKSAVILVNGALNLDEMGIGMTAKEMPACHAPDLDYIKAHMKETGLYRDTKRLTPYMEFEPSFEAAPESYKPWASEVRAAFLVPHLNLADLCRPENLLTFIHERGRRHPADFARFDYLACHIGRMSRILRGVFCGFTSFTFETDPDARGDGTYMFPNLSLIIASTSSILKGEVTFSNAPERHFPPPLYREAAAQSKLYGSGDAHIIRLSQLVTYTFLSKLCTELLKRYSETCEGFTESKEENPEKKDYPRSQEAAMEIEQFSESQRQGVVYSAELYTEHMIHTSPDFETWMTLFAQEVTTMGARTQNYFKDMEEFLVQLKEERDHHYSNLSYKNTKNQVVDGLGNFLLDTRRKRWDFYYDILCLLIRRFVLEHLMWADLTRLFKSLRDDSNKHSRQGEPLDWTSGQIPVKPLLGMTRLVVVCREYFLYFFGELVHRGKFVSSTKLRHLFTFMTQRSQVRTRQEGRKRLVKKVRNFPRVDIKMTNDLPEDEDLREVIQMMYLILGDPIAVSVVSMKKLVDGIRLLNWDKKTEKYISAHLSYLLGRMSILVDFATHLDNVRSVRAELEHRNVYTDKPWTALQARTVAVEDEDDFIERNVEGFLHLETLLYEQMRRLPAKRYRRVYDWIDEELRSEQPGGAAPSHTQDEAQIELECIAIECLDELHRAARYDLDKVKSKNIRDRMLLPSLNFHTITKLRGLLRPGGITEVQDREWDIPDSPDGASTIDSEDGNVPMTGMEHDETEDRTHDKVTDHEMSGVTEDKSEGADVAPHTASEVDELPEPAQRPATLQERRAREYQETSARRVGFALESGNTLTVFGPPRARTPSDERAARRQEHQLQRDRAKARKDKVAMTQAQGDDRRQRMAGSSWRNILEVFDKQVSVSWAKLSKALTDLGYNCYPSNGGSSYRFMWSNRCAWKKVAEGLPQIHAFYYHRPHPEGKMPPNMKLDFVKKLENAGLTLSFIEMYYKSR